MPPTRHCSAAAGWTAQSIALPGPTGQARLTRGHRLPAKYVIHAVGPRYRDGRHGEPELLASCYRNCLALAVLHGITSIALPAISCGIYGYPVADAAHIAVQTTAACLESAPGIATVIFACFGADVLRAYQAAFDLLG